MLNAEDYTISEMMAIANIDTMNEDEIITKTNDLISQYKKTKKSVADFYKDIQLKLLDHLHHEDKKEHPNADHVFISHVDKGVMNPLIKQTETKMLLLNSKHITDDTVNKTNYIINLSTPLKNVINIRLHSYIIPYTWYVIDSIKYNHILWIRRTNDFIIPIEIPSGNYTINSLVLAINQQMQQNNLDDTMIHLSYSSVTGKVQFHVHSSDIEEIIFFDATNPNRVYKNCTLGWMLGYRNDLLLLSASSILIADAIVDIYGSRYLYLAIDDYKRNRITNIIDYIVEPSTDIKVPQYTTDFVVDANSNTLVPIIPGSVTAVQTYNANAIRNVNLKNRNNSFYATSPNSADVMAVLPIKTYDIQFGDLLFETNQLHDYKREYYGPVTIDRLGVKLMDDSGEVINLNGGEWSITLIYEYIYQY